MSNAQKVNSPLAAITSTEEIAQRLNDNARWFAKHKPTSGSLGTAVLMNEAADALRALLSRCKQQQAELERLRGAVSQWASECGECLGEGVVMTKSGAIEYEPCPDCADIRAFLEPPLPPPPETP